MATSNALQPDAESYLRAIPGAGVVVSPAGVPLHILLPADPMVHEQTAFWWLHQHMEDVHAWVKSLGPDFMAHELIVVDDEKNWSYALKLLQRTEWPAQTSPKNCEQLLMSWAWWSQCLASKGRRLDELYAGILSRLLPGDPRNVSGSSDVDERARRAILSSPVIGSAIRMLDAAFDMDPKIRGWAKRWATAGFCKVEIAPKTAAALLLSDAPRDVMSPWKAFSIIVPPGLCDPVRRLWCAATDDTGHVGLLSAVEESGRAVATDPAISGCGSWCTKVRHEMLMNLACGSVIAIENGSATRHARHSGTSQEQRPEAPPESANWRLAAPIQVDFREEVETQWKGEPHERRKILVQFSVRGHYRNQACGPHMTERKRIWIHPYRKGDPSTVALLRRVEIGDAEKDSKP